MRNFGLGERYETGRQKSWVLVLNLLPIRCQWNCIWSMSFGCGGFRLFRKQCWFSDMDLTWSFSQSEANLACHVAKCTQSSGFSFFLRLGMSYFFILFIYLFIYFWLPWVFVAVHRLSLVAGSKVCSSLLCVGLLWWLLLLRSTGSRCAGFSSCGSQALERRLNSCGTRA